MLQIYPFYSNDVTFAYEQLNAFLAELAIIEISVPFEQIRAVTKTYPDYGTTATTIEVAVDFSGSPAPYEMAAQVYEIHQAAIVKAEEARMRANQKKRVAEEVEDAGKLLFSHRDEWIVRAEADDKWSAIDIKTDDVLVPPTPGNVFLGAVRTWLIGQGLYSAPEDFDPFLDADDLP